MRWQMCHRCKSPWSTVVNKPTSIVKKCNVCGAMEISDLTIHEDPDFPRTTEEESMRLALEARASGWNPTREGVQETFMQKWKHSAQMARNPYLHSSPLPWFV